jgi:hypothetical protein
MNLRVPIFLSYAHEDAIYLERLLVHLEPLRMQDQVCAWSDKNLQPGEDWHAGIKASIGNAKVYVLLVSQHFLASTFIRNSELPSLLSQKQASGKLIIPLMVRPCLYDLAYFKFPDPELGPEKFDLSSIQFFNDPGKPLSSLAETETDTILSNLARHLHAIATNRAGIQQQTQ